MGCCTPAPENTNHKAAKKESLDPKGSSVVSFKKINETPSKGDDKNSTSEKPTKELTKEDIVGTYEMKIEESTARMVILKNGIVESYLKDEKVDEGNVSIINGEVHIKSKTNEGVSVLRHEPNGDLKWIAVTVAGERKDLPKDKQETAKKIK